MDKKNDYVNDFQYLYNAFSKARQGCFWKDSIIDFDLHRITECYKISQQLKNNKYKIKGYYKFTIKEREKIRHISSLHITDRIYQRALCDLIVIPTIEKTLIYDNAASRIGKGTHFARKRCKRHLQQFYKKYGINGYILQIDIKKYFNNLNHQYLESRMRKFFGNNPEILKRTLESIYSYEGNSGIGLGSQLSQIFALDALSPLDHFIKETLHIQYFARYMDDMFLIHQDKEYLKYCQKEITKFLNNISLEPHPKKTQIFPLKNGIKYLGFHFYLLEPTGRVYVKLLAKNYHRNKRKFKRMIYKGVQEDVIWNSFKCWRATAKYSDDYQYIAKMKKFIKIELGKRRILMNQYFYAELNEENICKGVSALSGEVEAPHMIALDFFDESLIGKLYNNGIWEEVIIPEEEIIEEENNAE